MSEHDIPVLSRFSKEGRVALVTDASGGLSPASSSIAGITLAVDGGMSGR